MGLFDKIPKPNVELYCKNKEDWEVSIEGATQLQAGT